MAILVFDELKVNVVVTVLLAEFTAEHADRCDLPATRETAAGTHRDHGDVIIGG